MVSHAQPATSQDAAIELARCLQAYGCDEGIRSLEAIAAAIANRVDRARQDNPVSQDPVADRFTRFVVIAREHLQALDTPQNPEVNSFAVCLRIARRAVSGALQDPTRGATRFHVLGVAPDWAAGRKPSACVGTMFFYRSEGVSQPGDAIVRDSDRSAKSCGKRNI
jgi:hypothetical protein